MDGVYIPIHQMGFDGTGSISNKKFDTLGITTNSLGRRANPICLSFVSQECAIAYQCTYDAVETGSSLYDVLVQTKLCKRDKGCAKCDTIREQKEKQNVDALLHPSPVKKKAKAAAAAESAAESAADVIGTRAPAPLVFRLPLENPFCDNTTKFSKFIIKRIPKFRKKVGHCAAHLTGIAWQKKLHHKYFKTPCPCMSASVKCFRARLARCQAEQLR